MYTQTWAKYLPILKILLKRAVSGDQLFNLNVSDFKQAGATRKIGYKFVINFVEGRVDNILTSDIARDFATALLDDANIKALIMQHNYQISMNTKFQLNIKFISKAPADNEVANEELVAADVYES